MLTNINVKVRKICRNPKAVLLCVVRCWWLEKGEGHEGTLNINDYTSNRYCIIY